MIPLLIGAGALIVLAAAWTAGSSALLCLATSRWPLFVFPYDQWFQAVLWFRTVGLVMRLMIVGTAIPPTIVLILVVLTVFNLMRRRMKRPSLYGNSGWANAAEMRSGGIRLGDRR
jgi:hypothetical protein